jgi:hypothetical protein
MTGKTLGFRSTAAAVAAALWGMTPFAAQAVGSPQADVVAVTAPDGGGCGPVVAGVERGGKPFMVAVEPRMEAVKKDAPFSGIGNSEIVTTLADGNRIVRTNTMKYYRDSRGRTRTEYSLAAIGPFTPEQAQSVVTITDPIEGKRYVLHTAKKHADILPLPELRTGKSTDGKEAGATNSVARANAKGDVLYMRKAIAADGPGAERLGVMVGPPRVAGAAPVGPPVMVMSQTIAALPPANAGFIMQYAAPPPGAVGAGCAPNAKPLPAPTAMGERIVEGLKVTGTRMEYTIDAGAVGNEQPIVVSSEQWFSPELGVVVASTVRDPMMGDTTYKLEQVSRAEPDPSLFTIPSDYTTTDIAAAGGVFFESGVPAPGGGPGPVTKMGVMTLRDPAAAPAPKSGDK